MNSPIQEDQTYDNLGRPIYPPYEGISRSKRFLEHLCKYYYDMTGMRIGIIRPSGAYGRYDNFDEQSGHVIPSMIRRALRSKDTFEVWGSGNDVRDFPHAKDVARGLLIMTANTPNADPVNIGTGTSIKTIDLAKAILKIIKSKARIVTNMSKPSAIPIRIIDISKARSLGYEPSVTLEEGLKDTISWYRSSLVRGERQ